MTDPKAPRRETACRDLARRIARYFADGIPVDEKTHFFLENTLPDPAAVGAVLADPDHADRKPLVSLLFFPDAAIRVDLEPLLENALLEKEDEARVLCLVMETRPRTLLLFPHQAPAVELPVPADAAAVFIEKLHISRHLDPQVLKAVEAALKRRDTDFENRTAAETAAYRIKSMIRHSRAGNSRFGIEALCMFFRRFPLETPEASSCFSFFLDFLEAPGDEGDLYQRLSQRRNLYWKGLEKGTHAARQMQEKNPETRMLAGVRLPYVDSRDLMEKIDIIDRICFRLFQDPGA